MLFQNAGQSGKLSYDRLKSRMFRMSRWQKNMIFYRVVLGTVGCLITKVSGKCIWNVTLIFNFYNFAIVKIFTNGNMLITNENYIYTIFKNTPTLLLKKNLREYFLLQLQTSDLETVIFNTASRRAKLVTNSLFCWRIVIFDHG